MMNTYTQLLEQIIIEMKTALLTEGSNISNAEYSVWLDFLNKIKPESNLLKNYLDAPYSQELSPRLLDNNFYKDMKHYVDIREIMRLAEIKEYPTWFIQPKFSGQMITLGYEQGEIKNIYAASNDSMQELAMIQAPGVPERFENFTGQILGTWLNEQTEDKLFVAYDVHNNLSFLQKMELLKNAGFTTPEFVLFPTEKILSVSSHKLEASLQKYLSRALEQGLMVDGVVIISDTALFSESDVHSTRITLHIAQSII